LSSLHPFRCCQYPSRYRSYRCLKVARQSYLGQ
jgi:hypothetical protein